MKPSLPFPASLALAIAVLSGTKQVVPKPLGPEENQAGTPVPPDATVQPASTDLPESAKVKDFSTVIKTNFLKN